MAPDRQLPGAAQEELMELVSRSKELVLRVGGRELMCNKVHGTEGARADLACDQIGARPEARILIGGLGMGFTLAGFTRRMERAGFDVVPEEVRSRGARGGRRHVVWIGARRAEGAKWLAKRERR